MDINIVLITNVFNMFPASELIRIGIVICHIIFLPKIKDIVSLTTNNDLSYRNVEFLSSSTIEVGT